MSHIIKVTILSPFCLAFCLLSLWMPSWQKEECLTFEANGRFISWLKALSPTDCLKHAYICRMQKVCTLNLVLERPKKRHPPSNSLNAEYCFNYSPVHAAVTVARPWLDNCNMGERFNKQSIKQRIQILKPVILLLIKSPIMTFKIKVLRFFWKETPYLTI